MRAHIIVYLIFVLGSLILSVPISVADNENTFKSKLLLEEITGQELSIQGIKYHDKNGNGLADEGEPGLSNGRIFLVNDGSTIANTTTDDFGCYSFDDLEPGNYTVIEETLATGWNNTVPSSGSYQIVLSDKSANHLNFGNFRPSLDVPATRPNYPMMKPSSEELQKWTELYENAPKAPLDQNIALDLETIGGQHLDLLNLIDYVPSERYQGHCGNCWIWAGTGIMEIAQTTKTGRKDRLSTQYVNSNYNGGSGGNWACCGGNLNYLENFYANRGTIIPWSNANAHWQDESRSCSSGSTNVLASSISTNPNYPIISIQTQTIPTIDVGKETAIANIKNVLHQNKAVYFSFCLPTGSSIDDFRNFWWNQPEGSIWRADSYCGQNWNGGGCHAVLCVGYDDTDPNNRYWIMLNSWGAPTYRPNGLLRVNMDMNYNCYYYGIGYAFRWQTLDIIYTIREREVKERSNQNNEN